MAKEKIYAVFGLGTFGMEVCKILAKKGAKVIAIDKQASLIEKVKNDITQAMVLDSTDEELLASAPLDNIDVAVVAMADTIEASVLTTTLLKNIGIPYIIARAKSDLHGQILKQVGATEVINLEIDEGKRIANKLIAPFILETIPISKNLTLAEIRVPKHFFGKSLGKLDLRKKFNVNVVSIKRTEITIDNMGNPSKEEIVIAPHPDDILEENDILVVIGTDKDIDQIKE